MGVGPFSVFEQASTLDNPFNRISRLTEVPASQRQSIGSSVWSSFTSKRSTIRRYTNGLNIFGGQNYFRFVR